MPNVGDKFIIEIAEVYGIELKEGTCKIEECLPETMYRIRGTGSIVDEEELSKLEKYAPDTGYQAGYENGLEKAWEMVKKFVKIDEERDYNQAFEGLTTHEILEKYTAAEAIDKIKEYEDKKTVDDEIKVGDELQDIKTKEKRIVIICKDVLSYPSYYLCGNSDILCIEGEALKYWQKTGRHFPQVAELLKEMGENDG